MQDLRTKKTKKIIFLTQFFYPDVQATSQIFLELCEDLARTYEVEVVAGLPLIEARHECEKGAPENPVCQNLKIRRTFSFRKTKKTLFNRALNHASFVVSSFFHIIFHKKADIFIYTSDNPFNFITALLFFGKPKIYICQDLYLEQGLSVGFFKRGLLASCLDMAQKAALRLADKVVVIGERMKSYVISMGLDEKRIEAIPNWTDTDLVVPCDTDNPFSREHGLAGKFVVMHSGRIGLTQDLELLLECAARLRGYADMRFVIAGEGVNKENLQQLAGRLAPDNVVFFPYQPRDMLKYSLASASVGVILCKSGLSSCLVPSKLYAFMASARPVIASVDYDSEVSDVITGAGCGIIIKPGDLEGLKDAIERIYKDRPLINRMGSRGREYLIKNANRGLMTERYRKMIEGLTGVNK